MKIVPFVTWVGLLFASMAVTTSYGVCAQDTKMQAAQLSDQPMPPPTLLDMPLVGLNEGQRFQQERAVEPSSVSMKQLLPMAKSTEGGASLARVTGESLNQAAAEPVLGHPLPTSTKTPLGFSRADFAVDKGKVGVKAPNAGRPPTSALSNTIVQ